MTCWRVQAGLVLACVLSCYPAIHAQAVVPGRDPEIQEVRDCFPFSSSEHQPGPEVTIAELIFEGDLRMPISDQDEIATSLKQRTYQGEPDAVVSELTERVRQAWLNRGYFKVEVHADAHLLTGSPVSEQIAVTVHLEEGQQYRLGEIRFKNNRALSNVEALRSLFPIKDGDVLDRDAIGKGLENLNSAYGQYGYINFTNVPETQFNEERQTISIDMDIDEGKQFFVSSISILGLDDHLLKDSLLQPGDVYNQRLALLFIKKYTPSSLTDVSPESRIHRQLDERGATVALTYDFRDCPDQEEQ